VIRNTCNFVEQGKAGLGRKRSRVEHARGEIGRKLGQNTKKVVGALGGITGAATSASWAADSEIPAL